MSRLSPSVLSLLVLATACGEGETSPAAKDTAADPANAPVASTGGAREVIELQSSGSLRFELVAGRIDDGWCAHLVDEAGGVDVVNGSVTSSVQAGPAPRAELGELGSFSLFLRPAMGTPSRLRLVGADGSELRTINL
jgi:hypothetical protein